MIGRAKGSSLVRRAFTGETGREEAGEDDKDDGVLGNGMEDVGKGFFVGDLKRPAREGLSSRDRTCAEVEFNAALNEDNLGRAENGIFGTAKGVGDDAWEFSRCLTRSLVCNSTHCDKRSDSRRRRC